jgi:hypothetical protein
VGCGLVLAVALVRAIRQAADLRKRYGAVINVDAELAERKRQAEAGIRQQQADLEARRVSVETAVAEATRVLGTVQDDAERFKEADAQRRATLEAEYTSATAKHEALKSQIALLEENLEDLSFGLYKPHYDFQTSEAYKAARDAVRDRQRQLIRSATAAVCRVQWSVQNDAKAGQKMTKQYLKLILRAFNGEADAALANVSWNNVNKMEERVRNAYETINELGGVMQMSIAAEYLRLKLEEIRLTYELEHKRYEEREEQRRIREQIREEERAQRELDKAAEDASREESTFQKALDKARAEAAAATGAQLDRLTRQIATFEAKLDEARQKKERATARAQITKSGFVYVISNTGSFGERVFKIGMTRRLEPMERIAELGDASVPFPFDLHAMLYSDNAPELECALHQHLSEKRVNLVNARKEFYRDVELAEVEAFVKDRGLSAQFVHTAEAREYRETLAALESRRVGTAAKPQPATSEELFTATAAIAASA